MMSQLRNIDRAFQHIKRFSIAFLSVCLLLTGTVVFLCFKQMSESSDQVMVLYNGKVMEAFAASRRENLPVELRDHICTFHQYFFTLDPDEKAIASGITKALYLADNSAKRAYDNLKEAGYYNNLISANISQTVQVDSITLGTEPPFSFTCYATQTLIRASTTVLRKLVTKGSVRVLATRSEHNPHGFLIQNWETLVNADQGVNAGRL